MLVILGTGGATVLAAASSLYWGFELFAHFRVQYLVLQLLALPVLLFIGAYGWTVLLLLLAATNLVAIGPYLPGLVVPPTPAPASGAARRLVAFNLQFNNPHVDDVSHYLAGVHADILVLSEFTPRWETGLRNLAKEYPYTISLPRPDPWGIALYSRYPLRAAGLLDLGYAGSSNLRAVVALPEGPVELFGIHLVSPTSPERARIRNAELARLAAAVTASADGPGAARLPQLVVGDANLTPYSPYFGAFLRDSRLDDAGRRFGPLVTWPAWFYPLLIPIDHVFVGPGVAVRWLNTGPALGSDHLPLEFEFVVHD